MRTGGLGRGEERRSRSRDGSLVTGTPWRGTASIRARATLAVSVAGLICCSATMPQAEPRALVIGIDDYSHIGKLGGAVNDAEDLAATLRSLGVRDLTVLLDHAANRSTITAAIDGLLDRAKAGDRLIITYAGHGSQEPARDPSGEIDGKDEVFLLAGFDFAGPGTRERILDDEFAQWFKSARENGVEVLFVADACHSGTMTRSIDPRNGPVTFRLAPSYRITRDELSLDIDPDAADFEAGEESHVTFLAAGQDDEQIPEVAVKGPDGDYQPRGALSYFLAKAMTGSADGDEDGAVTRGELFHFLRENIRHLTGALQTPNLLPSGAPETTVFALPDKGPPRGGSSRAELPTVGLHVLGNGIEADALAGIEGLRLVASREHADLVWDPAAGDAVDRLGDIMARGVTAADLPAIAGKLRALEAVRVLAEDRPMSLRVYPDDGRHRHGARLTISIEDIRQPYLTVFSLSSDGNVHFLYPLRGDPRMFTEPVLAFDVRVRPPFGADHIIAVESAEPLDALHEGLAEIDDTRNAVAAFRLLRRTLADVDHRIGLQGIFTEPRK